MCTNTCQSFARVEGSRSPCFITFLLTGLSSEQTLKDVSNELRRIKIRLIYPATADDSAIPTAPTNNLCSFKNDIPNKRNLRCGSASLRTEFFELIDLRGLGTNLHKTPRITALPSQSPQSVARAKKNRRLVKTISFRSSDGLSWERVEFTLYVIHMGNAN